MKKLLVGILVMLSVTMVAQQKRSTHQAIALGIKGGVNLSFFKYFGDPDKNALPFDSFQHRLRPLLGVSAEIPLGDYFFMAPEVMLTGRGDARLFESATWNALMRYQAKTYYLEARLPMAFCYSVTPKLRPYVFAAPVFGLTMPMGSIAQRFPGNPQNTHSVAIDSSNMATYDVGVMTGAGVRFMIDFDRFSLAIKVEAGYHFGMLDTYSWTEHHDQAPAVNVNAYNVKGKRRNRGLEASVTVALPLRFLPGDACSSFSSKNRTRHRLGSYGF